MAKVKFISYDGSYPNLCHGVLVVEINEQLYALAMCSNDYRSRSCIRENQDIIKLIGCYFISGGYVDTDTGDIGQGEEWSMDLDDARTLSGVKFPLIKDYITELIEVFNENVEQGCCGGCI